MIPYDRLAWFRILISRRGSLAHGVLWKVIAFGVFASAICAVDEYFPVKLQLPVGFHEVAGVVIGLVLAFRTNTGYSRFWEGRTLWGGIVNASRNLARTVTWHADQSGNEARDFKSWIVAFAHATRCRLRALPNVKEAAQFLSPDDYQRLCSAPHPALLCSEELSRRLSDLAERQALDPILTSVAERHLATMVDCLGGCERISRTPTPLAYVLLIERTAAFYLGSLPLALVPRLGWLSPLVTMAAAYLVLMIETIGDELDDPFGNHPSNIALDQICATIAFDLLAVGERPTATLPQGIGDIEQ